MGNPTRKDGGADFARIRKEVDKLKPSFPEALDRAFSLMREHQLEVGGDEHHGLMRLIWAQYKDLKRHEWNLVRLPRQIHVEVHVLMAAAFVGTQWFAKFNSARMIAHAITGSRFDSPQWQKRIKEHTHGGKFYVSAFSKKYGIVRGTVRGYARRHNIKTASYSEVRILAALLRFDSPQWQKRIKEHTYYGKLYLGRFVTKYKVAHRATLRKYAKYRGIKTASYSEARILATLLRFDSPQWQKRIKEHTHGGKFYVGRFVTKYKVAADTSIRRYAKYRGIKTANMVEAQRMKGRRSNGTLHKIR
jgi:hypothetical protein